MLHCFYYSFCMQERIRFIEEFSKKTHLAALVSADSVQNCIDITEQLFNVYPS